MPSRSRYRAQGPLAAALALISLAAVACGSTQAPATTVAHSSTPPPPTAQPTPMATLAALSGPVADAGLALQRDIMVERVAMAQPPDCAALADPGYTPTCGQVSLDGADAVWLVEHEPARDGSGQQWFVHVYADVPVGGAKAWILSFLSGRDPMQAVSIKATTMPEEGTSASLLVIGFQEPHRVFEYAVIAGVSDDLPVIAGGLDVSGHGSVVIGGTEIIDYAGVCDAPGDCAPTHFTTRTLRFSLADHRLHVMSIATVPGPAPAGMFAPASR
jgi:hypothetical protein